MEETVMPQSPTSLEPSADDFRGREIYVVLAREGK